ncbi:hypothetical protein QTG54_002788 [Skeletonema marinoi]|uniref:Uncharacterized protein n=1 Tax=Skeletonema marinoi TaxID=267567 RepID=A0AAD8YGN8_9STRA|nr:hypothetical protein QTG54_002788 [Skeletonema marinoi]
MQSTEISKSAEECCSPFDPSLYRDGRSKDYKLIKWIDKPFVVDGTRCLFHVPLAFGSAVMRAMKKIELSGAQVPKKDFMILSDCSSPWWSDVLVSTSNVYVEGAEVTMISGLYLAKAFEGDYSNMGKWVQEINELVVEVKTSTVEEEEEKEHEKEILPNANNEVSEQEEELELLPNANVKKEVIKQKEDDELLPNTKKVTRQKDGSIFFYYPTCPKCAKKFGKNYVVIFAWISEV